MDKWMDIYVKNPDDDYNLMIELLCGDLEYGCIKNCGRWIGFYSLCQSN